MAALYDADGSLLTEGLQGCNTCDEAIEMALRVANETGSIVTLEDDDGVWNVMPNGRVWRNASDDDVMSVGPTRRLFE